MVRRSTWPTAGDFWSSSAPRRPHRRAFVSYSAGIASSPRAEVSGRLLMADDCPGGQGRQRHSSTYRTAPEVRRLQPVSYPAQGRKLMTDKIRIATCLWFNKNAEEAAKFYAATFPDSRVTAVHRSPSDYPSGKAGDVLTVEFTVLGQPFVGLNGGPEFTFDEAISFQVFTDTQEETDRYWNAIVKSGGEESVCGWCKDKFGLSWQIVPRVL